MLKNLLQQKGYKKLEYTLHNGIEQAKMSLQCPTLLPFILAKVYIH